jgi:YhcH/YjgK/YiaL family protein
MALFGSHSVVSAQLARFPAFVTALAYLKPFYLKGSPENARLGAMSEGESVRHDLGDGVFGIEQVYRTRFRGEANYESHRAYIDVQAVIEGEEGIDVTDIMRLSVIEPYDSDKDIIRYAPFEFGSWIRLGPGDLAVLFPPDGHMPCLHPGREPVLVRKVVVKVPVPPQPAPQA